MNDANKPGMAVAFDDGAGNIGAAQAFSDANVTVIDGLLTLDKVPDFGFGTAAAGGPAVDLQNNSSTIKDDGNDSGILQVTDSRTDKNAAASNTTKTAGFNVTAQLGNFKATNGTPAEGFDGSGFILNMNPVQLTSSTNANDVIQGANSETASLVSGDTKDTPVMALDAGSYSKGAIIAQFGAKTGEPNSDVQLKVPSTAAGKDSPSSISYNSIITWTLTPTAMNTTAPSEG
ncbi:WxL domain-containing protein [Companilactobacillus kedongensis]|uniref:WxL domain-containing protein n=1 Tax=Companilactobacillus kedongensis TaxID=2486004 RepID=UPI0013DDE004|nr:WxL domain-containing protein [Companilactobacillus kedongensis]